ncbi:hypothetical protein KAW65_00225 [candidate division WOR-3 bacterium]|nr:hypothetical protein [candidate division WOR-3 bacterium]
MKGNKNPLINGIVDIDVYKSTMLKESGSQKDIKGTFKAYHLLVEETFKMFGGKSWHQMGDGRIFSFPTPNDAVDACLRLTDNLVKFNVGKNKLCLPLFVRIGVHEIEAKDIADVPEDERGKFAHPALDITGKLQKNCPIGKITVSKEVYGKIGKIKQDIFRPALVTELRKRKAFVMRRRLIMPQEEVLLYGLSDRQKLSIPPIPFPLWDKIAPDENINLSTLDKILEQPLLVVLGETASHLQGPISSAATSDAIGIIEIMAALKSNIKVTAGVDQWEDTADLASNRNIILIGSGIVNIYAFAFNDIIHPTHFVKTGGRVFNQIVATSNKGRVYFGPHTLSSKDCGLITVSKSPLNLEKNLLWITGITGMGTQAAARFVWELIHDPKATLRQATGASLIRPIACIVGASISEGPWEISDYYRHWRISDYNILWMVDRNGKSFEFQKQ